MKTLIAGLVASFALAGSFPAVAQHHSGPHFGHRVQPLPRVVHHHHGMQRHWHPHHGWVWVVPTVIGGAIVYDIMRHRQQTAPITVTEEIVQTAPVAPAKVVECTEWKEIQTHDGKVYRERSCKEIN